MKTGLVLNHAILHQKSHSLCNLAVCLWLIANYDYGMHDFDVGFELCEAHVCATACVWMWADVNVYVLVYIFCASSEIGLFTLTYIGAGLYDSSLRILGKGYSCL